VAPLVPMAPDVSEAMLIPHVIHATPQPCALTTTYLYSTHHCFVITMALQPIGKFQPCSSVGRFRLIMHVIVVTEHSRY